MSTVLSMVAVNPHCFPSESYHWSRGQIEFKFVLSLAQLASRELMKILQRSCFCVSLHSFLSPCLVELVDSVTVFWSNRCEVRGTRVQTLNSGVLSTESLDPDPLELPRAFPHRVRLGPSTYCSTVVESGTSSASVFKRLVLDRNGIY